MLLKQKPHGIGILWGIFMSEQVLKQVWPNGASSVMYGSRDDFTAVIESLNEFKPAVFSYERLKIDEIREIEQVIHHFPYQAKVTPLLVYCDDFTVQAQNAFLKTLEELPGRLRFLLVVAPHMELLETVLSRVCIVAPAAPLTPSTVWADFKKMALGDYLKKAKEADRALCISLCDYIENQVDFAPALKKQALETRYLGSFPGASQKTLFESLVLALFSYTNSY